MSNVEFEENDNEFLVRTRRMLGRPKMSALTGAIIKTGLVKSERQASVILIVIAVIAIAATIWIFQAQRGELEFYVVDKHGVKYDAEEYRALLRQGIDPLAQ